MCLDTLDNKTIKRRHGYKVMYRSVLSNHYTGRVFPSVYLVNRWHSAYEKILCVSKYESYISGFHFMPTMKQALKYLGYSHHWDEKRAYDYLLNNGLVIVKVEVDSITATGKQYNAICYVAKRMRIIGEMQYQASSDKWKFIKSKDF